MPVVYWRNHCLTMMLIEAEAMLQIKLENQSALTILIAVSVLSLGLLVDDEDAEVELAARGPMAIPLVCAILTMN